MWAGAEQRDGLNPGLEVHPVFGVGRMETDIPRAPPEPAPRRRFPVPAPENDGHVGTRMVVQAVAVIVVPDVMDEDIERKPPGAAAEQQTVAVRPGLRQVIGRMRRAPVHQGPFPPQPLQDSEQRAHGGTVFALLPSGSVSDRPRSWPAVVTKHPHSRGAILEDVFDGAGLLGSDRSIRSSAMADTPRPDAEADRAEVKSVSSSPAATLDVDDTCDRVHGQRHLSRCHALCDIRRLLPVHICRVKSGKAVAAKVAIQVGPPAGRAICSPEELRKG